MLHHHVAFMALGVVARSTRGIVVFWFCRPRLVGLIYFQMSAMSELLCLSRYKLCIVCNLCFMGRKRAASSYIHNASLIWLQRSCAGSTKSSSANKNYIQHMLHRDAPYTLLSDWRYAPKRMQNHVGIWTHAWANTLTCSSCLCGTPVYTEQ